MKRSALILPLLFLLIRGMREKFTYPTNTQHCDNVLVRSHYGATNIQRTEVDFITSKLQSIPQRSIRQLWKFVA